MAIDREKGKEEAESQKELFESFDDKLPPEMEAQRKALLARLAEAPAVWRVNS
jgi:phosphoenolpyruvate carboxykinase (GTP)